MGRLSLSRGALSICVAATLLGGCGESQPPIGARGAMPFALGSSPVSARGWAQAATARKRTLPTFTSPTSPLWDIRSTSFCVAITPKASSITLAGSLPSMESSSTRIVIFMLLLRGKVGTIASGCTSKAPKSRSASTPARTVPLTLSPPPTVPFTSLMHVVVRTQMVWYSSIHRGKRRRPDRFTLVAPLIASPSMRRTISTLVITHMAVTRAKSNVTGWASPSRQMLRSDESLWSVRHNRRNTPLGLVWTSPGLGAVSYGLT